MHLCTIEGWSKDRRAAGVLKLVLHILAQVASDGQRQERSDYAREVAWVRLIGVGYNFIRPLDIYLLGQKVVHSLPTRSLATSWATVSSRRIGDCIRAMKSLSCLFAFGLSCLLPENWFFQDILGVGSRIESNGFGVWSGDPASIDGLFERKGENLEAALQIATQTGVLPTTYLGGV